MRRRDLITFFGVAAAWVIGSALQTPACAAEPPKITILHSGFPNRTPIHLLIEALAKLGYEDNRTAKIDLLGGEGDPGDGAAPEKKAEFFASLGQQQLISGDAAGAASNFKKANELDPKNLNAVTGMGEIALRQGLFGDDHQSTALAMGNLALCLNSQGLHADAERPAPSWRVLGADNSPVAPRSILDNTWPAL
jgi:hypothetical protein